MPTDVTYASYLDLDALLGCQKPHSSAHDEMLFIVIHQTKELWLKQMLHELERAQAEVSAGALVPAYKTLARISRIQSVMTQSWEVLSTMTPADYLTFRDVLGSSSGFQSDQFRRLEFMLGMKDEKFLRYAEDRPAAHAKLKTALEAPSLYDDAIRQLAAAGVAVPAEVLNRDVREAYAPSHAVAEAWRIVYEGTETHWPLYQLAEKLIDLDDALLAWRHRHVTIVERVIGGKPGTGGTAGAAYLRTTLQKRCFPELWEVRTMMRADA
ncbi:MAG: tryptophan 2,3-dioxygenase family protein [Pseudomonadota bacterium]